MIPSLEILEGAHLISPLDRHFALSLSRIADESNPKVVLAAALASRQVAAGHLCLDFARPDGFTLRESFPTGTAWPARDEWLAALRTSDLVECIGDVGKSAGREPTPLVLDAGGRLYLRRYWAHQLFLAEDLRRRAQVELRDIDEALIQHGVDRCFGPAG